MPLTVGPGATRWHLVRSAVAAGALAVDLWVWGGDTEMFSGGEASAAVIVAVAVAAYSCLAVWRSALPGYLALWPLSFAGMLVPSIDTFAGYLVALFLMARTMPRPVALMALVGSAAPIAVNTLTASHFHPGADLVFLLTNAGLWTLLMLATWTIGRVLARSDRRLTTERQWADDARSEALAVERLRISRDIHDIVAHSLTGIVLQAAGARAGLARDTASRQDIDRALESIQSAGEQSMRELHRLLGMLRETDETEARGDGIGEIGQLIDAARMSGVDVVSQASGEPVELDPSIAHTVYRVVQEGLSNAMKHGGAGARIEVTCDWLPDALAVTVRNSAGLGSSSAPSGGFGLVGLRERVSVSGGTLEAGPTANGYLLHATLPTNTRHASKERP